MQLALLAVAAVLTATSGAFLRYELVSPQATMPDAYGVAVSLHLLWAYFGLCVPLPFAMSSVALSRWPTDAQRCPLPVHLRRVAVVLQLLAALVFVLPLVPRIDGQLALIGIPLVLLAIMAYAASDALALRSVESRIRTPHLIVLCLSLVATLAFGIPCAIGSLEVVFAHEARGFSAAFDALTDVGAYVILAPATLALTWLLVRPHLRRAMLGLGPLLVFVVVAAGTAEAVVRAGLIGDYLAQSYWSVGTTHALLGGPALAFTAWWALPRHTPRRPGRWLMIATGVAFIAACGTDMLLGLRGMPHRYAAYDPVFAPHHVLAALVWTSFLIVLVVTCAVLRRDRPAPISSDDFS